jgi:asparagine synthase (glutamine-hydrolysing)
VDSGLLAARAASLGWKDAILVHYSMAEHDPETDQAAALARHLGLTLEIVHDRDGDDFCLFDRLANIWPEPFGDPSTLPTYALSRAVIDRLRLGGDGSSRVVLDGTGADGCFGMFDRAQAWHAVFAVPRALRRLGASAYSAARLWRRTGAIERRLRLSRRSCQMPALPAAIAQNPLLGIAYSTSTGAQEAVVGLLRQWLEHCLPCADEPARLAGLDLGLVCANIFAQKNKPVFDASAHGIEYPFLDQRMVGLALRRAVRWPRLESKGVLKAALAEQVPRELVYRRKSGFVAPLRNKFAHPRFLTLFDHLLDSASPLAGTLNRAWLQRVRRDLRAARALPPQTCNFIWAAVFTNHWLTQATVARAS